MLVLKLVHNDDMNIINELQQLRKILKGKNITIGLVESSEGGTNLVKIMCDDEAYSPKVKNLVYIYISNILYNIVIEQYRKKEMFDFIMDTYFFLKHQEIIEIEEKIMKVFKGEEKVKEDKMVFCLNKINDIIEKIKECIEENEEINIKGFITFRMKELRNDLEEVIDKVIEDYMVEKEYKEFVKLLKYFVDIQESKIDEINIFLQEGGAYILRDGNGNDVFEEFMKELSECRIDTEANIEDIIISGLITNAPKNVIIHSREKCTNKEFLDTIINVFGSRASFCSGCNSCKIIQTKI